MAETPTAPIDFDGWVIVQQYDPEVLLLTDIERIDTDHQDAPECDGDDPVHPADYALSNPEEARVLCQRHLEALYAQREALRFVMGALPAN